MAYKALYREWRPQNFTELIGQDHISTTLRNAVESGRIAHAYLFSGPRGTGKTSSAKILAKALNCETGPTPEPCNQCDICQRITKGSSMDVIEIDAASNRGIDEIRNLREKVKFAPTESRYKVYIIDEVHMLTTEAFNALLKTLEEPPAQVIFILATTEPYKIPATILSRVQRFDFKRISTPDIVKRLKHVTSQLPGEAEEDALLLIARKAEGGMRDALSLLDQCYSLGENLDKQRVLSVIGGVSEEEIYAFTQELLLGDTPGSLTRLNALLLDGKDPGQIIRELIEHLRNLLLVKTAGDASSLVYASREFWPKLVEQSKLASVSKLVSLVSLLIRAEGELRFSSQPRITLEVALINSCSGEDRAVDCMDTNGSQPRKETEPASKLLSVNTVERNSTFEKQMVRQRAPENPVENPAASMPPKNEALDFARVKNEWKRILDAVKKVRIGTYAFLVESDPIALNNDYLVLGFKPNHSFHREKIEQPENKQVVEQVLFSVLGYTLGIRCVVIDEDNSYVDADDLVIQTYKIFGPDIVKIKD